MLRFKKDGQQSVGVQQPFPSEFDFVALVIEHSRVAMGSPLGRPVVEDLDLKLVAKVACIEPAALELQDHLTN